MPLRQCPLCERQETRSPKQQEITFCHSSIGSDRGSRGQIQQSTEKKNAPRECIRNDHLNSQYYDLSNCCYRVTYASCHDDLSRPVLPVKEDKYFHKYFHFVADATDYQYSLTLPGIRNLLSFSLCTRLNCGEYPTVQTIYYRPKHSHERLTHLCFIRRVNDNKLRCIIYS